MEESLLLSVGDGYAGNKVKLLNTAAESLEFKIPSAVSVQICWRISTDHKDLERFDIYAAIDY